MGVGEDLRPLSWIVTVAFFVICAVLFALRVYTRGFVVKSFTWDDRLMSIAFILFIGQQYICWKWLILGGGRHLEAITSEDLRKMRLYQFIEQFYYYLVQLFIKLSFLVFIHRTLYTPPLSVAIQITTFAVLVQTIAIWVFYALQCRPLAAYFNPDDYPDAVCFSREITYCLPSAVSAAINVLIYILPIPTLARGSHNQNTRITTPQPGTSPEPEPALPGSSSSSSSTTTTTTTTTTLATVGLFATAGIGIIVSCLRIVVLYQHSTTPPRSYPYMLGLYAIVTTIELSVYIIASTLPSLRTLRRHRRAFRGGGIDRAHELREQRRKRRRRGRGHESEEDELWVMGGGGGGGGGGGKITITSRVSISITEALRGRDGEQRDGVPGYPKKYFKFARPGAQSPTPNSLKDVEG